MIDYLKLLGIGVAAALLILGLFTADQKYRENYAKLQAQRCTCQQTNAVVTVEAPEKPAYRRVRVLPDHIKIQVSNGGRYRWVAYSKEYPDGWSSVFDYDSYEAAYDAWWSFHKYNLPRQNWTNVTP